jgi:hypothetical protein
MFPDKGDEQRYGFGSLKRLETATSSWPFLNLLLPDFTQVQPFIV